MEQLTRLLPGVGVERVGEDVCSPFGVLKYKKLIIQDPNQFYLGTPFIYSIKLAGATLLFFTVPPQQNEEDQPW